MALPNGKFSGSRWMKGSSPGFVFSFMLGLSDSKSRPNDSKSCRFHGSQLGPNIGVLLLRFGRRLEAANEKAFQSAWAAKPFGIRYSLVGLGGRWICCVSMSCFVLIWYLMGNYRGRMIISYLSCCACCHAPRNRSWRTGDVGWLSLWGHCFNDIFCIIFSNGWDVDVASSCELTCA